MEAEIGRLQGDDLLVALSKLAEKGAKAPESAFDA